MASIKKRKNSYAVIYKYVDDENRKKQKWETFPTYKEALNRKTEIEHQMMTKTFIQSRDLSVKDFLCEFVELYGTKKWGVTTYRNNVALIENYINPLIGKMKVQDVNSRYVDRFIQRLQETAPVTSVKRKLKNEYLPPSVIKKIHVLLKCAFKQAIRWELIVKNPFEFTILPKVKSKRREMWTAETIREALDSCTDARLYLAINLAFACSLRIGEILGLTWEDIHVSLKDIKNENAHLLVNKELKRVSKDAMEILKNKDILFVFPDIQENTKTCMVLKTPKTESSVRKVWIPKTVAYILRDWKNSQEKTKDYLGKDYIDYNLVVTLGDGRPCQSRMIEKSFKELKSRIGLPDVVFHSLRHSSTTYKLKINNGDIKAVQGDTGHSEVDMITKVYAHILDEDRKINAQKFENAFYTVKTDLREVEIPTNESTLNIKKLLEQLKNAPEFTQMLSEMVRS